MPFRRRRRFYRRRRGGRRKATTWGAVKFLANKAWRGVRAIRGLINVEKHYLDTGVSTTIDTSGSITLLSGIAQGDDVNSRQGNSVLGKTLYSRVVLLRNAANTTAMNSVRIMVIRDLNNVGSAPTVTDVLASATVHSPLNVDHTARYQVILDKVISLSVQGQSGVNRKWFLKVPAHLKFTGSSATDVYKNALYLLLVSDQASSVPSIASTWRLGYYDN